MVHLKYPRTRLWHIGVLNIFFYDLLQHFRLWFFLGGQMSFWGVTSITNLVSIIPFYGDNIVIMDLGWTSVGQTNIQIVSFY